MLDRTIDWTAKKLGRWIFYDPVLGSRAWSDLITDNLRESVVSKWTSTNNRQRQMAYVLLRSVFKRRYGLQQAVEAGSDLKIFNTQTNGSIHKVLSALPNYVASEYLDPNLDSGTVRDGLRHEDIRNLSFADNTFDCVLSSDVLEHVPNPYAGHREIFRVLKPGGRHIFTVPFGCNLAEDDVRAELDDQSGKITYFKEAIYHEDPLRPEGCLVFTVFSPNMIEKLKELGYHVRVHQLHKPLLGILGDNAIVFEAIKPE